MADDLTEQLESILKGGDLSVEGIKAQLPQATNPAAHAPKAGHESSDEIIARQVNEQAPATTEVPAMAESTPPAISTEVETETQTQTQEPLKVSVEDALFAQLRQRYPGEPLTTTAARVEAAFSQVAEPQVEDGPDPLVDILDGYQQTLKAAEEAENAVNQLMGDGSEVVEYTPELRKAEREAIAAQSAAENAFNEFASQANQAVEADYPELNDANSPAYKTLLATLEANPSLATSSPVAVANTARHIAATLRATMPAAPVTPISASPTRVPAPAAPVPPAAGLASTVQASHASSVAPPPGQQTTTDDASRIRSAGSIEDLAAMFFGKGLKGTVLS